MTFPSTWINPYNSLVTLYQDPTTGMLTGTYSSTTDGSGTYDVVGWASLAQPTPAAGQTIAISILWRSNDNGKSDPSHEVSGMAGQVVALSPAQNLIVVHLFVETNPNVVPKIDLGTYPDKLTFTPHPSALPATKAIVAAPPISDTSVKDNLSGKWSGMLAGKLVVVTIQLPNPALTLINGTIEYLGSPLYPIVGFTDIFASLPDFHWQGITFSTYIDEPAGRRCIVMAGYLDLVSNTIKLTQLSSQATASDSTWYQVGLGEVSLVNV